MLFATLIGVGVWQLVREVDSDHNQSIAADQPAQQLDIARDVKNSQTLADIEQSDLTTNNIEGFDPFAPELAILNFDCYMRSGKGSASNVAVVILRSGEGTKFVVLDESGELTRGELDFRPNHLRIGRRSDGSVVYGFGDLRLNSKVFRAQDSAEPIRIFQDNYVIYESDKAWDFDVAHDGSSFFVHEPTAGGTSRLRVRNLDSGTQVEHDLGTRLSPFNDYSSSHAPGYSLDATEIVFTPAHADAMGRGVYWFYPVGDGKKLQVTIEGFWSAMLTSSENGYFVQHPNDIDPDESEGGWRVSKRRLRSSTREFEELWSVELNVRKLSGLMSLSENGKWLGLSGNEYMVLDTDTGETIFTFPYGSNREAQLVRLAPNLAEGATIDDIGQYGDLRFKGNHLVGYRILGGTSWCSQKSGEEYDRIKERECIRESRLLGKLKEFFDIYDMNSIELSSSPTYTTEVYSESNCNPANPGWKGLVNVDGKLAFRPVPPMETINTP